MSVLPVTPAAHLADRPAAHRWLVEELWAAEAVGIVGGEPKCGKSFLALDLAVAVASGTPCLRRFAVPQPGRVLLYAAEDPLDVVRRRVDGICQAAGVAIDGLDLQVITAPALRLDVADDRRALAETVAALAPRLLVLDPFVRLHRVDENAAGDVAPLLAYLRDLQRRHHLAVLVVHHARKGGARLRAGQALRGSSALHAWGDSNLYLRHIGTPIALTIEHRAAAARGDLTLALHQAGEALALAVVDHPAPPEPRPAPAPHARVERALAAAPAPLTVAALRAACRMRTTTLCEVLADLVHQGRVRRTAAGYVASST